MAESVIFLDFDGVLNTKDYILGSRRNAILLDPYLVRKVTDLAYETGSKIVISSAWRSLGLEKCKRWLRIKGMSSKLVIGATPTVENNYNRGAEIQKWLDEHPETTKFVILDDDTDMLHLHDRLVHVNRSTGITDSDFRRAKAVLEGK